MARATTRSLRLLSFAFATLAAVVAPEARADADGAGSGDDDPYHFMGLLARHGWHDKKEEAWNLYSQITDIWTVHPSFSAKYTNFGGSTSSLHTNTELSFTETWTLFFGFRLWPGAEAYIVPELLAEKPFSNLTGLGGDIQNFELQKTGVSYPKPYLARAYVRQILPLGGATVRTEPDQMQLGRSDKARRLVLTLGNFSVLDFFDKNSVTGDPRKGFLNMAFMTYAAFDFCADARGYTWGGVAELDFDDWTFRLAHTIPPKAPNQLALDFRFWKFFGDEFEIEHDHKILGHQGAVHVVAYRNRENMGRFSDAIAAFKADPSKNATTCPGFNYGSMNANAPDLCWARQPNTKVGIGISLEQHIIDDVGVFFRAMWSDGKTEVYTFTPTDRSLALGTLVKGSPWKRPADSVGFGWAENWISGIHAQYLGMGGVDGFIGDGKIHQASEGSVELFYSLNLGALAWLTLDYQEIWNPGFNSDRGPVSVIGWRAHVEY